MKMAVEFDLAIFNERRKDVYGKEHWEVEELEHSRIISEVNWLDDSMDFNCDVLDPFLGSKEFESLEPDNDYHIFQYGNVHGETSWTEYGSEFDGWIFEPEITKIQKLPKPDKEVENM